MRCNERIGRAARVLGLGLAAVLTVSAHGAAGADAPPNDTASLLRELSEGDAAVRLAAARALAKAPDTRIYEAMLARLASDDSPDVRALAARTLAGFRDPRAAAGLIAALDDKAAVVRAAAIAPLERIVWLVDASQATSKLIRLLGDDDAAEVRAAAAKTLATFAWAARDPRAVTALTAALDDASPAVRSTAVASLNRLAGRLDISEAVPKLIRLADELKGSARCDAVSALGSAKDPRAREPLTALLRDADDRVRTRAAAGLRDLADTRSLDVLIAALTDPYWGVQATAAEALGALGDARAVDPLLRALDHRFLVEGEAGRECLEVQQHLKRAAMEALIRLGKPAVAPLIGRLTQAGGREAEFRFPRAGSYALCALERLTNRRFGPDANAWQKWWAAHQNDPLPAPDPPPAAAWKPGDGVVVREGTASVQWREGDLGFKVNPGSGGTFPACWPPRGCGPRLYRTVEVENRYLRLVFIPGAGGVIGRVVYKPMDSDMFWWNEEADNGPVSWYSGVKPCFPYKEHGIRAVNQPASWRVVRHDDGAVTVAMWMEFSRFDGPWNEQMFAQYGNMLLAQRITLRPDEAVFRATYRIFNPAPYRQGRQFWQVATWPYQHTRDGIPRQVPKGYRSKAEWIFPASHVSGHGGAQFREYATESVPLGELPGSSVFAWAMEEAYAGLWFPEVKVNRMRITQPDRLPGAKQFLPGRGARSLELWTGTDSIFEEVENWIGPGESWGGSIHYAMTEGIGKVDFANEHAALNVELDSPQPVVESVTFRPAERVELRLDGKAVGAAACGPTTPARFPLPKGAAGARIELIADGTRIVDRAFPIVPKPDEEGFDRVRRALKDEHRPEMLGNSATWSLNYRRTRYAAGTTDRGRVLYRDGLLKEAAECLRQAAAKDADDGEAWHLLGAALLEQTDLPAADEVFARAVAAGRPYPPAHYFLALSSIRAGRREAAEEHLRRLLDAAPSHWEGQLLLASLEAGRSLPDRARALAAEEPADPRAQYVLWKAAGLASAKDALDALSAEPGTPMRLAEFIAAAAGRYVPPVRMLRGQRIVFEPTDKK